MKEANSEFSTLKDTNRRKINDLLYVQMMLGNAIKEYISTLLKGKDVPIEEIKERISYIAESELRD